MEDHTLTVAVNDDDNRNDDKSHKSGNTTGNASGSTENLAALASVNVSGTNSIETSPKSISPKSLSSSSSSKSSSPKKSAEEVLSQNYFILIKNTITKTSQIENIPVFTPVKIMIINGKRLVVDDIPVSLYVSYTYIPSNENQKQKSFFESMLYFTDNHVKMIGYSGTPDYVNYENLTEEIILEKLLKCIQWLDSLKFCKYTNTFKTPGVLEFIERENKVFSKFVPTCSVCSEPTIRKLSKCSHYLCVVCFKKLVDRNCPICRTKILEYIYQCEGYGHCDDCRDPEDEGTYEDVDDDDYIDDESELYN